jgi:hypothetical protein
MLVSLLVSMRCYIILFLEALWSAPMAVARSLDVGLGPSAYGLALPGFMISSFFLHTGSWYEKDRWLRYLRNTQAD